MRLSLVLNAQAEQARRELAATAQAVAGVRTQAEGASGGIASVGSAASSAAAGLGTMAAANDNLGRATTFSRQGAIGLGEAMRETGRAAQDSMAGGADVAAEAMNELTAAIRAQIEALRAQGTAATGGVGDLTRLARSAATAGAAILAGLGIGRMRDMADNWSDLQSRIGAAIRDMEAAPELMQDMLRLANDTYSSLDQTVSGFASNVGIMRDLGYSTAQTRDFTEALNHSLVITATKGQQAASVQMALSRAMATGRLQADGLETVLANGGRVAEALATELGTTVSGLRDLASQGRITGDVIARAMLGALSDVRREAGEMPSTVADGFLRLRNSITALVGTVDQALGASAAAADLLNRIAEGIGELAQADFEGLMLSMATGGETLAQVLLVVSATRIPATVAAIRALNVSTMLMTTQFTAGAIASRGLTAALAAKAVTARALAGAMAMLGGPIGLAAAGVTALGLALWNTRSRAGEVAQSIAELAGTQGELNRATDEFYRSMNQQSLDAMARLAQANVAQIRQALEAAQRELENASFYTNFFGLSLGETDRMREARENVAALSVQMADAEARSSAAEHAAANFSHRMSDAADSARVLSAEQQKALSTSNEMLTSYQRRAELARIELDHGRSSVAWQITQMSHEREALAARLDALDITRQQRAAVLNAWEAALRAEGGTRAWDAAMATLLERTRETYNELRDIEAGEPGGGWLDRAISKAQTLAGALWEGVSALGALADVELDDAGNPLPDGISRRNRPRRAPVGIGGIDWGTARSQRGGRGKSEAEQQREAVRDLVASLRQELDVLRELDPVRQEMIRHRDTLAAATGREKEEIEGLIRTRLEEAAALEDVQRRMEDVRDLGHDAIGGLIRDMRAGVNAGNMLSNVLDRIADKLADVAATDLSNLLFGARGATNGGSGLFGGFLGSLFGIRMNALGDVIGAPTLFAYGDRPGQLGVMGEAGAEAIMPLTHAMGAGVGALVGNRETTLPLTRLASGKLGVSLPPEMAAPTPFARGGAFGYVPPPPLGRPLSGPASGAQGDLTRRDTIELRISVDDDLRLRAAVERTSASVAAAVVQDGVSEAFSHYDRNILPERVHQISSDPWRVG
ncbi:tape measure protein [Halodurantibacterium flavum]|uniref:Tape measure protein n=1 Tax=Halodurantibacterium flavum TaxID=1382802 RepID=A0ABW4S9K1_9RHOB